MTKLPGLIAYLIESIDSPQESDSRAARHELAAFWVGNAEIISHLYVVQ
ncbi:hypothetical protein JZ785_10550 [Alicyclobacillus curvatus]|nr:hypothetical protein JZ785_10550 [Alicyclobacillus curvatus]